MFQQTATPEEINQAAVHVPAALSAAPDKKGAPRDPFIDHYFKRIDPRLAETFTPEQREAIKTMFGARGMAQHAVEIRRSLPIGRRRYYLVLLLGRERRTFGRLNREGAISGSFNLLGYAITAALWTLPAAGAALLLQAIL
ncbi:hypothetical protein [Pelagibius marinus]|uniref:hypothetical protein n=1 Tax=Pelagibius marinus TaxID=2762760 RepID=UPI0018726450|nr:hypothetical protein [Pelagibius marinus]